MTRIEIDEEREYRIEMDVIVDAYDTEERAMGWYYYMAEGCDYPFKAICVETRKISPLEIAEEVEVLSVSSAEDCRKEIFVDIKWNNRNLAVPLSQLEGVDIDSKTKQVIEDWCYWCRRGYEF